ncbi:MAG: MBL fold metallo-hydrolase [Clostridia bacterium]|nr:MBL fold metallo-hydrolase [Clostridia bacterium]
MLGDMKPFNLAGNIYFVGTYKASSHLIDTGDGLILIDTGYAETADVIAESVAELGFDIRDVKYILHSHGHYDHTGGTPKILELTGAKTFISEDDVKYISGWKPDHFYRDGQVISLGNTQILCVATPGHTEGTFSFFFDVDIDGKTYRAGMFGGAGTNQLKKAYLHKKKCSWLNRGLYFESVERLKQEHVDIFLGNHTWNNQTKENYERMLVSDTNPFIDETKWLPFLQKCEKDAEAVMLKESRDSFVNYAHRGASEYTPENTFLAFYTGMYMGANGIETDVQMTKDGVLVLFHDDTITRLTGAEGRVSDYTLDELRQYTFETNGQTDKIVVLEDFLRQFAFRDITFAIEIKQAGIEPQIADMIRKYHVEDKAIVTSFMPECIRAIKEYAPELHIGLLTKNVTDDTVAYLKQIGAEEICPRAVDVTPEKTAIWHREGLNVRPWGVKNEELMRQVYDSMADGMTVNFPDKLAKYIREQAEIQELFG